MSSRLRRTARRKRAEVVAWATSIVIIATGCTPALNWRDTLVGESGVMSLFPCHPDVLTRKVRLGGTAVDMTLRSCAAAGLQFGIADAVLPDAADALGARRELQQVAAANIGADAAAASPTTVKGLDVAAAVALRLSGHAAGQSNLQERALLFTVGPHVLQASVVGERLDEDAADTFFAGLNVPR